MSTPTTTSVQAPVPLASTLTLSLTDLQNLCTTIANSNGEATNQLVTDTFNTLFSNLCTPTSSVTIQQSITALLTAFEQVAGNTSGTLTASDFSNFGAAVKADPLVLTSFITTVTAQAMTTYNELATSGNVTNMSQETVADFVFRVIAFIIIVSVVKTNNGATDYLQTNMTQVFSLLTLTYDAYLTFVASNSAFTELFSWLKSEFVNLESSKCCVSFKALFSPSSQVVAQEKRLKRVVNVRSQIAFHNAFISKSVKLYALQKQN
ncbi:MAG: hypothetical protein Terrestrivirus3_163 [Terrestrivirus sp.]|uniref:Uncharacterized protein n=1 Tax=Terrestrivirus sp. TaxID=2487775 RepID=A0A3G4ZNA4_9VIRU|nr:MAG: hypothetical protein Terrestrivirus3_163 [Terrestrivirus sp.]